MKEIWDAYYRDRTLANIDLVRGEDIPDNLYHLVCEVLVQHIDGDFLLMKRDLSKPKYGGYYEATAGGAALKGEDKFACIKRELLEETGITSDNFEEISSFVYDDDKCLYNSFFCLTDCDKSKITLQKGETMEYKWISEVDFISFVNSNEIIELQKMRYLDYFKRKGYLK